MAAVLVLLCLWELGRASTGRRGEIFISRAALRLLTVNALSSRKILWGAYSRAF